MKNTLTLCLAVLVFGSVGARADGDGIVQAGQRLGAGGGAGRGEAPHVVAKILEHAQELNLSADQKTKLQKIEDEIKADREKLKNDPALRDLFQKMREAHKNNDRTQAEALRKQMRGEAEKQIGADPKELISKIKDILTPEQREKVRELIGKNGGAAGGEKMKEMREKMKERKGATNDAQRPAPGSPAPVPFDDQKPVKF